MSFIRTRHHRLHPDSGFVLPEREVTPQAIYADRRRLLQGLAGVAGVAVGGAALAQGPASAVKRPG